MTLWAVGIPELFCQLSIRGCALRRWSAASLGCILQLLAVPLASPPGDSSRTARVKKTLRRRGGRKLPRRCRPLALRRVACIPCGRTSEVCNPLSPTGGVCGRGEEESRLPGVYAWGAGRHLTGPGVPTQWHGIDTPSLDRCVPLTQP